MIDCMDHAPDAAQRAVNASSLRRSLLLGGLMGATALGAHLMKPGINSARSNTDLGALIPEQFGAWRIDTRVAQAVVNPQAQALLDKLYNQVLSRSYVNGQGQRVMLSLAYGGDQRGSLEAHKPEVCYPAQGFKLHLAVEGVLNTPYGSIPVRRLDTSLGARREPLTYWFTVGDSTVASRWEKRLVEIRLGLTGQVPDGLLFRVSSIDVDAQRAWQLQERFVADLLAATGPANRRRLVGSAIT